MNFKLEYLDENKINKFITKYELIDLVIFENITYASGIGVGMNNPIRSKTNCYSIDKKSFVNPSGFNNNLIEKSISLRGEGKLGYKYLQLAYYENNLPELLKSYINNKISKHKCSITIKAFTYDELENIKTNEAYYIDTFKSENKDNSKIASAKKGEDYLSYITFSIKHYETTESQIGYYELLLNEITIFDQEEESLFYIIKDILALYIDVNLTRIKFPKDIKKEKYIKHNIVPRLEQNLYSVTYS